ncbi:hypothetical protein L6R53_28135 [Myxococcota bacterium]|jgi:hypothetical protein|nr:hypothetical protein [Myxococcota bacterium]
MKPGKITIIVFQGTFVSAADGTLRRYLLSDLSEAQRKQIGQASRVRVAIQTTSRTTNCRLLIRLFETAGLTRPTALGSGYTAFYTSSNIETEYPQPFTIDGPYCDNVDLALDVLASTGSTQQTFQGTVALTLFFD